MSQKRVNLSIVIVNWNTRELLVRCLQSVYDTVSGLDFEVLVVDNASADGSSEAVQRQFPAVRLTQNTANAGFARACNQGIRESVAGYVLLLNPDTEVMSGAVQTLVQFMEEHRRAGAVGPMVLHPDRTLQASCYPMPTLWRELLRLMHLERFSVHAQYEQRKWDPNRVRAVEVIQGDCLLVRRESLSQVGLFDEDYFMYTEEVDLCYRLLRQGWSIFWVPKARIVHHGGQSTRQVAQRMFIELYRSKLTFFRKTRGKWGSVAYKMLLLVTALTRVVGGLTGSRRSAQVSQRSRLYWDLIRVLPSL